jgi:hypothetical protein
VNDDLADLRPTPVRRSPVRSAQAPREHTPLAVLERRIADERRPVTFDSAL